MNLLKKARILSELRQIDVFHRVGIWPSRLSQLENGLSKPRLDELRKLSDLYKEDLVSPVMAGAASEEAAK